MVQGKVGTMISIHPESACMVLCTIEVLLWVSNTNSYRTRMPGQEEKASPISIILYVSGSPGLPIFVQLHSSCLNFFAQTLNYYYYFKLVKYTLKFELDLPIDNKLVKLLHKGPFTKNSNQLKLLQTTTPMTRKETKKVNTNTKTPEQLNVNEPKLKEPIYEEDSVSQGLVKKNQKSAILKTKHIQKPNKAIDFKATNQTDSKTKVQKFEQGKSSKAPVTHSHKKSTANNKQRHSQRSCKNLPLQKVIFCEEFSKVSETEFVLHHSAMEKKKIFSTVLVDEYGRTIFVDRLGSEHLQGSLNNFKKNPIYSIVFEAQRQKFLEDLKAISGSSHKACLKFIIYSKNSKRRYSSSKSSQHFGEEDIYNLYLKCLTAKVWPIEIQFSDHSKFQGEWNQDLVEDGVPLKCFMFMTRLSAKAPDVQNLDYSSDKMLGKFINYTKKRTSFADAVPAEPHQTSKVSKDAKEPSNSENGLFSTPVSKKSKDPIFEEHKEYEKSTLTKKSLINSCEREQQE